MKDALELFASHFAPPGSSSGGGGSFCIPSLTGSADAFLALTLARGAGTGGRVVLAVTPGLPDADRLAEDLLILAPHQTPSPRILEFPPGFDDDKASFGTRMKTIAALKSRNLAPYPCVVVASFPALTTPVPARTDPLRFSVKDPNARAFGDLVGQLAKFGYERLPQVEKEGDCSVRGGIVDIWSPG